MEQHKDLSYLKNRKVEVERTLKIIQRKRENTLYLYNVEKQSQRKARDLRLQVLLEYEAKELQRAQIESQAITLKIATLEKEQQKHKTMRIAGMLSLFIVLFTFVALVVQNNHQDAQEMSIRERSISNQHSWAEVLSSRISAFLNRDGDGNNLLTGATVTTLSIEETILIDEPMNISLEQTIKVTNETYAKQETTKEEIPTIGIQDISIQNAPSITLVLNTTNLATNDTNVNLTAYNTTQTDGNSLKVIYNWLRNGTSITTLNMPFEGINGTTTNNAWDYSGYGRNGSERDGILWSSSGGYDRKGAYVFDGINDDIVISGTAQRSIAMSQFAWIYVNGTCPTGRCGVIEDTNSPGDLMEIAGNQLNVFGRNWNTATFVAGGTINDKQWYHVGFTYNKVNDSAGNITLYVNGAIVYSEQSLARNGTMFSMGTKLNIGSLDNGGREFNGTIDDIISFNRTLSKQEVYALWTNQTNIITAEETIRAENWAVQATPNNGTGDGTVVISSNVTILNTKPTISALTLNTTNISSNNTNVNLTAYATTSDADNDSIKVIYNWFKNGITTTLLNMPFEKINNTDTLNAWDYSGLGNNGSENGATWNSTGGYDSKGAYMFDGINDYVGFAKSSNPNNISITAWVRPRRQNSASIEYAVANYGATMFSVILQATDSLRFYPNVCCASIQSSAVTMSNDQWHHVAVTYNYFHNATNGNATFYFDGAMVFSSLGGNNSGTSNDRNIGRYQGDNRFFNGTIDDIIIWNRTLSRQEIYALWQNQTNVIAAEETFRAENWTVQATPNDGFDDGAMIISNNLTIMNAKPTISALTLNTTNISSNNTDTNLTAYATTSDVDSDSVKVIYNWLRNGTSITTLNMPFEGINGTTTNNARDYSGYGNNGSEAGATWNATAGYDGKGAYMFDGINDRIRIAGTFQKSTSVSLFAWIYLKGACPSGRCEIIGDTLDPGDLIEVASSQLNVFGRNWNTQAFVVGGTINNDQWYHVGFTYKDIDNLVGNLTLYVNGAIVSSTQSTARNGTMNSMGTLDIGGLFGGGREFNGTIDEILIFNRTLSPQEVYAIWTNQTNTVAAEETFRAENWTVQATPNDGYDDGAMVISNNLTILNAKPTISALTLNTTNISSNNTDTNLTAYATTTDADSDSVKVIYNWLRNGTSITLLNMPFEKINNTDTLNAWDYSGLGNNGSENGATWNSTGGYDSKGAYMFDGINDYVGFAKSSNPNTYSIVAWVKPRRQSSGSFEYSISDYGSTMFLLNIGATDSLGFFPEVTGNPELTSSAVTMNNEQWHHVAITYNYLHNATTGNATFYFDGSIVSSVLGTNNSGSTLSKNIGRYQGDNRYFNGTIDDLIIFNRTLSPQEVYALWTNQTNVIAAQETIRLENWTVQATPNDGFDDGAMVVSNNLTIINSAPTSPVLWNLTNGSTVTTRTPTFVWNVSSDLDGDAITYRIEIDDNIAFNNLEVNAGGITNTSLTNVTYTLSTELSVDTSYFWRVFANDSSDGSNASTTRNFTVQSYLAINVTDNLVAFGTLSIGTNVSTPANAQPFRAENVGNIIANITVTGTPFFTAVGMPSDFYRFKIRANESGAFNVTASATEWNLTNTTLGANIFHVINLDWHSISNDFITDLNVSVPLNESAGSKSSTVTFTITG